MLNFFRHAANKLRAIVRQVRLRIVVPDVFWRDVINERNLPFDDFKYQADESVVLLPLDLELPKHAVTRDIVWYYRQLCEIILKTDAKASWNSETEELEVKFMDETYSVRCAEEVYTLHELLVLGDYNIFFKPNVVLMDIGANVGFTSIFLAAQNPGLKVMSYEPLKVSYSRAQENISTNKHLASRIELQNFGLSNCSEEVLIQSEVSHRTRSSIVFDRASSPLSKVEHLPIRVKKASEVVCEVLERNPDKYLWIKMDCEGCEFAVLEDLATANCLDNIQGMILEWHALNTAVESVQRIHDLLVSHEFCVYLQKGKDKFAEMGLCFAVR